MNSAVRLEEFKKILANYHIASGGQHILTSTKLALLLGPTATGRDTIIKELLKSDKYYFIVSDTTRHPRVNNGVPEQNGVEYWFRTEREFLDDLKAGKLLEAEVIHNQHVSGISIRELEKAHEHQKIAITNVDLNIRAIVANKPDAYAFMVLPPSFPEWMKRLDGRGNMPSDEKHRRMQTAKEVFKAAEYDYFIFVINDTVSRAAREINRVIATNTPDRSEQTKAKQIARKLLADTEAWLQK